VDDRTGTNGALTDQVMNEHPGVVGAADAVSAFNPAGDVARRPWRPTQGAIERLLNEAFAPAEVVGWHVLEPWSVLRADLVPGPPSTVIVKWLRDHPGGVRTDPAQQLTEFVALQFLSDLGLDLSPRVLAADLRASVLVLEDLAPRTPLAALLAAHPHDPAAAAGLIEFAATTGCLHAATAGQDDRYYLRRLRHGPVDRVVELRRFFTPWPEVRGLADSLGVALTMGVESDIARALEELTEPGPFLAFSNGDAGVNNFLLADGASGKLIDYEFAGFRHALCDIACLYVPGPMWITVADPSTDATEDAYRAAVSHTIPEVADDRRYGTGVSSAALSYALFRLGRLELLAGRPPGDGSRLQMVAALEAAAATAARFGVHRHLAGWARHAADRLRRRWPDTDVDLAARPAYGLRH
jgi:hypothetical protein